MLDRFNAKSSPVGTLYLTTSHLIFIDDKAKKELWILHTLLSTIERPALTTSGSQLRLTCSHFQTVTFVIQRDRDAHDVYLSLVELSRPREVADLYCFSHNPKADLRQSTGWHFHDLRAEFQRQGVPNSEWAVTGINKDHYGLCPTYPEYIVVPVSASRATVEGSARFRSKGRLPVLTYLHKNSAALIRCAQPLVGIGGRRSASDEEYMECLRKARPQGKEAKEIHVVDTRPMVNAKVNMAGGKGHENDRYYENMVFSFKGIENIHKMRKSLEHLVYVIAGGATTSMDGFMSELANSGWLKHIRAILDTSVYIVDLLVEGNPVVVHCSDGWDRTSQTCALACLMLDGYYRTVQGFQALIEKDWLAFGHKFQDRCGHLQSDPNEVSPVFLQFLDCVWQLTHMFPQAFQFNEKYLVTIHEHVYSCQYGTLIGNCEKQRIELKLKEKTYSLWGYLVAHNDEFVNPLYENNTVTHVLRPSLLPQNIRFWRGLYCRFEAGAHPREPIIDLLAITQNHTSSLEDHGRQLTKTIQDVASKISTAKATGMLRSMMPTSPGSAAFSSSATSVLSPGKTSIQDGSFEEDDEVEEAVAALDLDEKEEFTNDLKASVQSST